MRYLVVAATGVLLCGLASAAELYVSPQGRDANAGSREAPFATIQAAVNAAKPGDAVLVTKGIYREKITGEKSGEEGKRIVIRAEPRRAAIMEGFDLKANYLTIQGFQITHMFSDRTESACEIQGNFNEVVDNYIYGIRRRGLGVEGDQNRVARNKIQKVCQGLGAAGKKWVFENNEVSRIFNYGELDGDYARFFGEDGVWRGNFFHGNLTSERAGHPDGWQTFDDNNEYVKNILFEKNIVGDTVAGGMLQSWYGKKSGGLIFRNNVFYNLGQGLSGGTIPEITVVNNVFYNVQGACGGGGAGSVQKNNIYYGCKGVEGTDYNLLFNTSGKPKGTGNLLNVDPMFVNPEKLDFRLKPGSPAIDAGDPSMPVPPGGGKRIDIGAYEFGADEAKSAEEPRQ